MEQASRPTEILVVEDDPDVRDLLSELLRQEGYSIVAARDGDHALACVAMRRPDLVVTDLMMPGKNGAGLLRDLAAHHRIAEQGGIPTILLTAAGSLAAEHAMMEAGVRTEVLHKPLRIEEFLGTVRRLLALTAAPPPEPAQELSAPAARGSEPPQAPE